MEEQKQSKGTKSVSSPKRKDAASTPSKPVSPAMAVPVTPALATFSSPTASPPIASSEAVISAPTSRATSTDSLVEIGGIRLVQGMVEFFESLIVLLIGCSFLIVMSYSDLHTRAVIFHLSSSLIVTDVFALKIYIIQLLLIADL
jgi:hypothetical protein